MNKLSILLLCLFAAAFSSCKDDNTETPDLRLFAPEVTDVTGTAASVSCSAAFRLSEHVTGAKGFAYGPASDAVDTYLRVENPTLDGNMLACRLSGLAPETAYKVFAYAETSALRVISPVAEFTTLAVAADEPVLEITSLTTLAVPASGGDCTITYTVLNPAGDILPEAACEAVWIRFLDAVPGEIAFSADENTGDARETTITIAYPGAESRTVTVRQDAAERLPELTIESETTLSVPATEGAFKITYSVANPVQDAEVGATCPETWVGSFDCSVAGEIAFVVATNPGAARETTIEVTYPGAESRMVTVRQDAAEEERPDPAKTVVLTPETAGWPGSYQSVTTRVGEYRYRLGDVAVFSDKIQFKSGSGVLSNAEEIGDISRIELVYTSTNDKNIRLYTGDAPEPTANEVRPEQSGERFVFDCTGSSHRYFTLQNGSGVSYLSSITIVCGSDRPDPEPGKPAFGKPSFSDVTKGSATLRCPFIYQGDKTVSQLYFVYRTGAGAEQRCDAIRDDSGAAVGYLTNLSPLTTYTFRLRAEIGGETYSGEEASFTTASGGGQTGKTKYSGWAELVPEDESNSDYHYAYHLCPDLNIDGNKARNYTVCFSAEHHCPVWVAAPRHACYEGSANRTNAYKKDPDIPSNIQYNSKDTGGGCNKGHMLGSAERTRSTEINRQVFYYSNIAPQYSSGFNTGGGGWNTLEDWIDKQVCADTTYLVIGTYFEPYTDKYGNSASPKKISFGGRNDVSCPTMFYMAVLRTKKGNSRKWVVDCSADELKSAVFVRCHNNALKGVKVSSKDMISVAELEKLTGHTFFSNVPNAPKESYTPSDWGL